MTRPSVTIRSTSLVVSLAGHLADYLELEGHRDRYDASVAAGLAEEAVVVTPALAEPCSPLIEGEPGHQHHSRGIAGSGEGELLTV